MFHGRLPRTAVADNTEWQGWNTLSRNRLKCRMPIVTVQALRRKGWKYKDTIIYKMFNFVCFIIILHAVETFYRYYQFLPQSYKFSILVVISKLSESLSIRPKHLRQNLFTLGLLTNTLCIIIFLTARYGSSLYTIFLA